MKTLISVSILAIGLFAGSAQAATHHPRHHQQHAVPETKSLESHSGAFDDPTQTVPISSQDPFYQHLHDTAP
jgi:hypothetical protein